MVRTYSRASSSATATSGIASDSHRSARSGASRSADASSGSRAPSWVTSSPRTVRTDRRPADRGRQDALCERDHRARARREDGGRSDRRRLGEVRGEDREGTHASANHTSEYGAAEQLEVVGDDEERPHGDEHPQPGRDLEGPMDAEPTAPASPPTAMPQRIPSGISCRAASRSVRRARGRRAPSRGRTRGGSPQPPAM